MCFSYNDQKATEKIKFVLDASTGPMPTPAYRPCIMSALSSVQAALEFCVVTDIRSPFFFWANGG